MQRVTSLSRMKYILLIFIGFIFSCNKEAKLETELEEQFYFENGKSRMPVWVHGNSKSKVFILTCHGGPGLGRGLELRAGVYAEKLEEKYAMVYWDQRAQGSAQGHLDKSDVTMDHMVEDIHVLIGVLKAKYGEDISLFLMGHSWGGTLSTAYLIKEDYQHELKGWINISGAQDLKKEEIESVKGLHSISDEKIAIGSNVGEWKGIKDEISKIDTSLSELSKEEKKILFKQEKIADNLLKTDINDAQLNSKGLSSLGKSDPGTLLLLSSMGQLLIRSFYKEIAEVKMTDDLSKIVIPALIQGGKYDLGPPESVMNTVYNRIGSTFKYIDIYEYSGHASFETEPDLFNSNVIEFIELHK